MPTFVPALVPAFVPAPVPTPVPAFFSRPESPVLLSSSCVPALAAVSCCGIPVFMLPFHVFGLPLLLGPLFLKTFKQSLLDEPQPCVSTSLAKPFCPFLALGVLNPDNNNGCYNLTNHNKRKWGFDTTFINSRPLASNHDQKEVNLSFAGYRCPATVKLN